MSDYEFEKIEVGDEVVSDTGLKGIVLEVDQSGYFRTYLVQYIYPNNTLIKCHHPEGTIFKIY